MNFIEHKLIKPNSIEIREYQTNLANDVKNQNCLIVLPTGLGKTTIALQVIVIICKMELVECYSLHQLEF